MFAVAVFVPLKAFFSLSALPLRSIAGGHIRLHHAVPYISRFNYKLPSRDIHQSWTLRLIPAFLAFFFIFIFFYYKFLVF